MSIIYRIVGLLLLTFFAFSDIVAFPIRLAGFIIVYTAISGIEIGAVKKYWYAQGRKESVLLLARLEDLESEKFSFAMIPIQEKYCSLTGNCSQWYAFVESSAGGMIPIEISVSDGADITKAMGKKFISEIEEGDSFEINENHEITKV